MISLSASAGDDFPTPRNTEPSTTRSQPAVEAAAGFRVPAGFRVSVFAAEPDVQNPIAMAWDRRGRLWVAENYTYADTTDRFDLRLRDRVLIFEDTDGDGTVRPTDRLHRRRADARQHRASDSAASGSSARRELLFMPDRNGDDVPDGPAEVVLDGFTVVVDNHHTFANGLQWGPDGWLYGRCGASSPGQVGAPGTPEALRIPFAAASGGTTRSASGSRCSTHGTTNPWGHDWNALGEAFFINTVNGHLWHLDPGEPLRPPAHDRARTRGPMRSIDQHADHWHWDNAKAVDLRQQGRSRGRPARRRPRPQRTHDLPGRPVAGVLSGQAPDPELPRPSRERRAARTLGQRLRRPPRARHALRRATPGSAGSTWATAPTAASICSTGATPASATITRAFTAPPAGSTR